MVPALQHEVWRMQVSRFYSIPLIPRLHCCPSEDPACAHVPRTLGAWTPGHLLNVRLNNTDCPPWCGWASSKSRKTNACLAGHSCLNTSKLGHRFFSTFGLELKHQLLLGLKTSIFGGENYPSALLSLQLPDYGSCVWDFSASVIP